MKYRISTKYLYLRGLSFHRKKRKSKAKKKQNNIFKNRPNANKNDRVIKNPYNNKVENITIDGGTDFALLENPVNVIDVVNKLENYKSSISKIRHFSIDLSKIEKIDIGAISFLLAKVNEFTKNKKVRVSGNMPLNNECKNIFIQSGFLDYMTDLSGNKFKKQSENYLINVGGNRTKNEKVGKSIEKSMKYLTGIETKYPPVYSIIQEICSNSVEWANATNSKNKNWLLGINYISINDIPQINFTLTDVGYGILKTLKRKLSTKFKESISSIYEPEILMRAFEGKYESKTGEINRNRGMPLIKKRFEKHYICDLKVMTNNVYLDFSDINASHVIDKNFPGTFYTWNVNQNCLEVWKQTST
jgi:hypothetical protein